MRIVRTVIALPFVAIGTVVAFIGGALVTTGAAVAMLGLVISGEMDSEPEITPRRRHPKVYSRV